MQKDIGDNVHIGQSVMWFQSIGKSVAVDKTASDFDNANLKIKNCKAYWPRDLRCIFYLLHSRDLGPGFSRNKNHWTNCGHNIKDKETSTLNWF